jgi:hypothetical protein
MSAIEGRFTLNGEDHVVSMPVAGPTLKDLISAVEKFAAEGNALVTHAMGAHAHVADEEKDAEDGKAVCLSYNVEIEDESAQDVANKSKRKRA